MEKWIRIGLLLGTLAWSLLAGSGCQYVFSAESSKTSWTMPGPAPELPPGVPPAVPDLSRYPSAQSRIKLATLDHPIAEVKQMYVALAAKAQGTLLVVLSENLNDHAAFAGLLVKPLKGKGHEAALVFDAQRMENAATIDDILDVWATTEREIVRWKQLMFDGRPAATFVERYAVATDEECAWTWKGELEANAAYCRRANGWGLRRNPELCPWVGDDADFRHALYLAMTKDMTHAECVATWARMAGHPAYQ
ncbi:hypothetical protein HYS28_03070 [Candidatus Uhrbacteria bacterium]|nr:hypothetical protein [Candidatus Uhrbacteria bacterium]